MTPVNGALQPRPFTLQVEGAPLAGVAWNEQRLGQGPTLLLVHATGFHGRVWDPVLRRLPPCHAIALDLPGHGLSPARPFSGWEAFSRVIAAAAVALDLQAAVGVGHSMGAHTLLQAASWQPGRFARLLAIDPVLFEPGFYLPQGAWDRAEAERHPAAARKNRFASVQALMERFAQRIPYAGFHPEALQAWAEHALKPADDGDGFELRCAPLTEACIYTSARHNPGIYAALRALDIPVTIARVRDRDMSIEPFDPLGSPTWAGVAGELRRGRDLHLADRCHLLPMDDPVFTAGLIAAQLQPGALQ